MTALTRVKLQGFRGAKKPLELTFSNSVVLKGHSGSGKTSILQAIEWENTSH